MKLLLDELSVRSKAIDLVNSVLEQSVQYLNSRAGAEEDDEYEEYQTEVHQQSSSLRGPQVLRFGDVEYDDDDDDEEPYAKEEHVNDSFFEHPSTLNVNLVDNNFLHSDSENFAITCDLSNGAEFLKSPTIESISGKSFDENISPQDERDLFGMEMHLPADKIEPVVSTGLLSESQAEKIERRFDRLSSQLDEAEEGSQEIVQTVFEQTVESLESGEVSQLHNEFSKLSWDDSQATTTADHNLSTPENDLQSQTEGDDLWEHTA